MNRMLIVTLGVLVGTVVVLLAALSTYAGPNLRPYGMSAPIESTPEPPEGYRSEASDSLPSLSTTQRERARDLALRSSAVLALIEGRPYQVKNIEPMMALMPSGTSTITGAVVTVGFDSPQTVAGTWYASSVPCDERGKPADQVASEYNPAPFIATWADLESIRVWVNFERNKVYLLLPGDGGRPVGPEAYPPGEPTPPKCGH